MMTKKSDKSDDAGRKEDDPIIPVCAECKKEFTVCDCKYNELRK
jgi:hypothetical protein